MLALLQTKKITVTRDHKPYLTSQIPHSFLNKNSCTTGAERTLSVCVCVCVGGGGGEKNADEIGGKIFI